MDHRSTYINAMTALAPQGAKIPIHFDTDREAIDLTVGSLALPDTTVARVVRISDTLSLSNLEVSEAFLEEVAQHSNLKTVGELREMQFDAEGNLSSAL
jgi:hypothetical protein